MSEHIWLSWFFHFIYTHFHLLLTGASISDSEMDQRQSKGTGMDVLLSGLNLREITDG